jgi:hypothetical protein
MGIHFGVDVVRMAEFAWLDRALAGLDRQGIKAVIGTPAAAYRAHAERIVRAMARHFGKAPNVVGWQIDKELGNSHDDLCHCPSCKAAFQAWLKRKYGSVEELNRRWGTAFWGQGYDDFGQIPTPAANPVSSHSPSLLLDWRRFRSELIVDFMNFQADIIREETEGQFITHNLMGFFTIPQPMGSPVRSPRGRRRGLLQVAQLRGRHRAILARRAPAQWRAARLEAKWKPLAGGDGTRGLWLLRVHLSPRSRERMKNVERTCHGLF